MSRRLEFDEPRATSATVGYTGHIHHLKQVVGATFSSSQVKSQETPDACNLPCVTLEGISGYSGERPGKKLAGTYGKSFLSESRDIRNAWDMRFATSNGSAMEWTRKT